jgi:hypothetical protein
MLAMMTMKKKRKGGRHLPRLRCNPPTVEEYTVFEGGK